MRGRFSALLGAIAVLTVVVAVTPAAGDRPVRMPPVEVVTVTTNGGILPAALPKAEPAPTNLWTKAVVHTPDGSHPPAAETVVVAIDKNVSFDVKGLPVCERSSRNVRRKPKEAVRECKDARLGGGELRAEIQFPDLDPISLTSGLHVFNGGEAGGVMKLVLLAFQVVPTPAEIVTVVEIERVGKGRYGTMATATFPKIAGGSGSVTALRLRLGKRWTHNGSERSLVTASCPDGRHQLRTTTNFVDGTSTESTIVRPCIGKEQK